MRPVRTACVVLASATAASTLVSAAQPVSAGAQAAFLAECKARADAALKADEFAVAGKDGWLFLWSELRHLGVRKFWGPEAAKAARPPANPRYADPLPAILHFKAGLDKIGVELLIVPVPPKAVVYAEKLSDQAPVDRATRRPVRCDRFHQAFYTLLGRKGVKVLDLTGAFLAARKDDAKLGAVYCKTDTHWSGRGIGLATDLILERIRDRPWLKPVAKRRFESRDRDVQIHGDLARLMAGRTNASRETVRLRFVGTKGGLGPTPVEPDRSSPVLLLGDSHTLVFQMGGELHVRGAGLADQLALKLGFPVDLLGKMGSGATPARIDLYRRGRQDPAYWPRKKLVVWCFSAREFTEAAWRIVPVAR